jgi:signal transduction histidine kinase
VWRCELTGDPALRLPEVVEEHLFRIVQQACENALRHSRAEVVQLVGALREQGVILNVTDDGVGFDTESLVETTALLNAQHYGLVGMRERATLIGARVSFRSAPQQGTEVSVCWDRSVEASPIT